MSMPTQKPEDRSQAPSPRPGDKILDRYLHNASSEEREEARETLREWAKFLIKVGERIMAERVSADETRHNEEPTQMATGEVRLGGREGNLTHCRSHPFVFVDGAIVRKID